MANFELNTNTKLSNFYAAGEWWKADVEEVEKQGNNLGIPPNMSDAHTINGKPGPLFPCSEKRKDFNLFIYYAYIFNTSLYV